MIDRKAYWMFRNGDNVAIAAYAMAKGEGSNVPIAFYDGRSTCLAYSPLGFDLVTKVGRREGGFYWYYLLDSKGNRLQDEPQIGHYSPNSDSLSIIGCDFDYPMGCIELLRKVNPFKD